MSSPSTGTSTDWDDYEPPSDEDDDDVTESMTPEQLKDVSHRYDQRLEGMILEDAVKDITEEKAEDINVALVGILKRLAEETLEATGYKGA